MTTKQKKKSKVKLYIYRGIVILVIVGMVALSLLR